MTSDEDGIFLKNCWYVAAWDHELIDGRKLARTILGKPVVLYQGESGRVVAMDDRCCHRGAPLSMGRVEGDCIRCMYHGMKFDPSGKCIQIPGQDVIPAKLGVRSYPIVARDHLVWIWRRLCSRSLPTLRWRISAASSASGSRPSAPRWRRQPETAASGQPATGGRSFFRTSGSTGFCR